VRFLITSITTILKGVIFLPCWKLGWRCPFRNRKAIILGPVQSVSEENGV